MKNLLLLVIAAFAAGACSAPKYTYYFDHYDYNSGKKVNNVVASSTNDTSSPLVLTEEATLTSDASTAATPVEKTTAPAPQKEQLIQKIKCLSRAERQDLKKELKTEIKKLATLKKSPDQISHGKETQAWDRDLKLAAIFGAVGLVLSLFGGVNSVFWVLSVVALVIAVVFLIKWLARQ